MNVAVLPRRYAVIGNPVAHSRSPWIHARFGQQTRIALRYDLLPARTEAFTATAMTFFAQGGSGLNVTVPFKANAYALAQHLSARARMAQAANTLWVQDGVLHGCNTDGVGLVRDVTQQGIALAGQRVLLVGAGGAARGVWFALLEAGCAHLRIVNRTEVTARQLAAYAQSTLPSHADRISAGGLADAAGTRWNLVINASASSLSGQAPALPDGLYAEGATAYDMMYGAAPSPFLHAARTQGAARLLDGLGMLVHQAAESFRLWHGVTPDARATLAALRREMQVS